MTSALVQTRDLAEHQAMHIGIAHGNVDGLQTLLGLACLLLESDRLLLDLDVEEHTDEPHGEQDAADTERVGHRIAHPHQAGGSRIRPQLGQDLLASPQGRGIGHGPGKDPEDHRQRYIEQLVQRCRHQAAEQNQQGREAIELEARTAQGGEEAGTDLDAYGVDEQDQAEFLNKMKCLLIQLQAGQAGEVAHYDAAEQHPADTQTHAIDPPVSQPEPQHCHQRQHADGKRDLTHRLHPFQTELALACQQTKGQLWVPHEFRLS